MGLYCYCSIVEENVTRENFGKDTIMYKLNNSNKGVMDDRFLLLFDKNDEIERGWCKTSIKNSINNIDKTLSYIKENFKPNFLSYNEKKYINDLIIFLNEQKTRLNNYQDKYVVFDFSDFAWFFGYGCVTDDHIKEMIGSEINAIKRKIMATLNHHREFFIRKDINDKKISYSIKKDTPLAKLSEKFKDIINFEGYNNYNYDIQVVSFPNNKQMLTVNYIVSSTKDIFFGDISLLLEPIHNYLFENNISYCKCELPEEYKKKNKEYYSIQMMMML